MKLFLLLLTIISIKIVIKAEIILNGQCPSPRYVSSGLSCSTEGDDSPCPWDYKCCPLIDGMKCFSPCPEFTQPCTIQCPFGLKVDPVPCYVCECASDPCLSTTCPLGTKCISKDFEPCAIKGRCDMKTECIDDPSIHVDPTPKPKKCPDYWSSVGNNLQACKGPDALCPGEEKCCQAPANNFGPPNGAGSYCVQPCDDISNCTLQCPHGLVNNGSCQFCQCAPDPCDGITCAFGETCRLLPTPCAHFPGRPPCPLTPVCMKQYLSEFIH
ncbi:unnamed protein product [Adineta steineri]|uniref:Antistasin-like domain-containing protein n=3 Tax=Adineta steineri TaxID=433720 RepID=A0A815CYE0_9BILA|nr:unnamed protein product [Adineta steineri]CAF1310589.1 unnamed protein product [Adineta steineri]CAF3488292.1 unnamed protein product [Adineta steineri]